MKFGNVTVLPAAGLATRMRGLPKFMLPCTDGNETLIERHIRLSIPTSDLLCVVTRPSYAPLLASLGILSDKVLLSVTETETMNATVKGITDWVQSERFTVIMPDTFFGGQTPYQYLASAPSSLNLALWTIRESQKGKLGQIQLGDGGKVVGHSDKNSSCDFPYAWGALSFSSKLQDLLDPSDPHVGYMIEPALREGTKVAAEIMDGDYFDCGTPSEFQDLTASRWVS